MTADELREKLDELFDKWKEESEFENEYSSYFHKDGPFDTTIYLSQECKILFLLKEPNGNNFTSIKCFYNTRLNKDSICYNHPNEKYYNMWHKLREWTEGILTYEQCKPYDKILEENISRIYNEDDRLRKIAILNVKKYFGGAKSDKEELKDYAKKDKEFIKKEIRLLNPDIIVCGGTWSLLDIVTQKYDTDDENTIATTLKKITEKEDDGGVLTIDGTNKSIMVIYMNHPSYFYKSNKYFYDMLTEKYGYLKNIINK